MANEQQKSKKPEPSIRRKRQLEQMARVKKAKEKPRVRVTPRDDEVRRLVKHPRAGAFRSSGSLEWPDDTFTQRRIREGVVKLEASRETSAPKPAPPQQPAAASPQPAPPQPAPAPTASPQSAPSPATTQAPNPNPNP